MAEKKTKDYPIKRFKDQAAWEAWLAKNHTKPGIWMQFAKKASGITTVNYVEALDVALCWGWIDSQTQKFDDKFYLQKFTPRGPRSPWSQVNKAKVAALIAARRMRPPGQAAIDLAQQNGEWDRAFAPMSTVELPADFAAALRRDPKATAFYETLPKSHRAALSYELQGAKKPETRQRRFDKFLAALKSGKSPFGQ